MKNLILLSFFTMFSLFLPPLTQAQIKIHNDGHVSLGNLTKSYGVQVKPSGYTYLRTQNSSDYSWANLSIANNATQKHWIIENQYNPAHTGWQMFYVQGNGDVYARTGYSIISNQRRSSDIDGEEALSIILGLSSCYYDDDTYSTEEEIENSEYILSEAISGMLMDIGKQTVGISGENLSEIFPESVRTDSEARLCINYQAITAMLVEAVKQQQKEIDHLKKMLTEKP